METHFSTPAWRIPWTEEPGGLHGVAELDTTEQLTHTHRKLKRYLMVQGYTLSTLPSAGSRMGQAAPGRQDGSTAPSIPSGSLGASVPATAGLEQIKG